MLENTTLLAAFLATYRGVFHFNLTTCFCGSVLSDQLSWVREREREREIDICMIRDFLGPLGIFCRALQQLLSVVIELIQSFMNIATSSRCLKWQQKYWKDTPTFIIPCWFWQMISAHTSETAVPVCQFKHAYDKSTYQILSSPWTCARGEALIGLMAWCVFLAQHARACLGKKHYKNEEMPTYYELNLQGQMASSCHEQLWRVPFSDHRPYRIWFFIFCTLPLAQFKVVVFMHVETIMLACMIHI